MASAPLPSLASLFPLLFQENRAITIRAPIYASLCYQPPLPEGQQYQGVALTPHHEDSAGTSIKALLDQYPLEQVQSLHGILKNIFPSDMVNEGRLSILQSFLSIPSSYVWNEMGQQIVHLLPSGSRGVDIIWVAALLASVQNEAYRELLIETASSIYTWRTPSYDRACILACLIQNCPTTEQFAFFQRMTRAEKNTVAKKFVVKIVNSSRGTQFSNKIKY